MNNQEPCRCDAYKFPHRAGSGACGERAEAEAMEREGAAIDWRIRRGWSRDRIAMDDAGHKPSDFY